VLKQNFYIEIAAGQRARLPNGHFNHVSARVGLFGSQALFGPHRHSTTNAHTHSHKGHFGQVGVAFLAAFLCGILFVAAGYKFVAAVAGFSTLQLSSRHCHRLATKTPNTEHQDPYTKTPASQLHLVPQKLFKWYLNVSKSNFFAHLIRIFLSAKYLAKHLTTFMSIFH